MIIPVFSQVREKMSEKNQKISHVFEKISHVLEFFFDVSEEKSPTFLTLTPSFEYKRLRMM